MRVLKLLRQFGASFDMQNYRGDLPFHEAVQTGNSGKNYELFFLNEANG
jgi:ankyrin repeat protein